MGIKEGELRSLSREKATTDSSRDLFPTNAWLNVNWTSPGVALLVSIARLGKSSQTLLYVLAAGLSIVESKIDFLLEFDKYSSEQVDLLM